VGRDEDPRPRTGRSALSQSEIDEMRHKIPTREKIADYIEKQRDSRHSLEEIATHFLGKVPKALSSNHGEKRLFFTLQDRIADARKRLTRSKGDGNFKVEAVKFGKSRVYTWVREPSY
jgi:hypothetical protein